MLTTTIRSTLLEEDLHGSRLLHIVSLLKNSDTSGRSLTQLPELSILRHLKEDQCDLDMAFQFIEETILANGSKAPQCTTSIDTELRASLKRKHEGEDGYSIHHALDVIGRFVSILRGRADE